MPPVSTVASYGPMTQQQPSAVTVASYAPMTQQLSAASYAPMTQQQLSASSYAPTTQQSPAVTNTSYASMTQQPLAATVASYTPITQQMPAATVASYAPVTQLQPSAVNVASYAPITQPQVPPSASVALEQPKPPTKDWRVTDLDTDYDYECEGTATLNRPKGLVKLRPMAKITAKTREEIAEAIMDIPDSEFKSLINQSKTLDGWSSLDGSPRHGPSTVPRSATLKRAPPPVPKRSNSAKGEKPPVEVNKKEERPSAVKQLMDHSVVKSVRKNSKDSESLEEFPPPPSPLPSVDEKNSNDNEKTEPMDELFNNPLFRQRRKDSAESSSSIDSSALPFANETVGTIKQKSSKPYPALPIESSQVLNKKGMYSENTKKKKKISLRFK